MPTRTAFVALAMLHIISMCAGCSYSPGFGGPYDACVIGDATCSQAATILGLPPLSGVVWTTPPGNMNGGNWGIPGIRNGTLVGPDGSTIGWFAFRLAQVPTAPPGVTYVEEWWSSVPVDAIIMRGINTIVSWIYHPMNPLRGTSPILTPNTPSGAPTPIASMSICWAYQSRSRLRLSLPQPTGRRVVEYNWALSNNRPLTTSCQNIRGAPGGVAETLRVTFAMTYAVVSDMWTIQGTAQISNPDPLYPALVRDVIFFFPSVRLSDNCSSMTLPRAPSPPVTCQFSGSFSSRQQDPLRIEVIAADASNVLGISAAYQPIVWMLDRRDAAISAISSFSDLQPVPRGPFTVPNNVNNPNDQISTSGTFNDTIIRNVSLSCGQTSRFNLLYRITEQTSLTTRENSVQWCFNVSSCSATLPPSCRARSLAVTIQPNAGTRTISYDWSLTGNTSSVAQCIPLYPMPATTTVTANMAARYTAFYNLVTDLWQTTGSITITNPDMQYSAQVTSVTASIASSSSGMIPVAVLCNNMELQQLRPGGSTTCTFSISSPSYPGQILTVNVAVSPSSCVNGASASTTIIWQNLQQSDVCIDATSQFNDQPVQPEGTFCVGVFISPLDAISRSGSNSWTSSRSVTLQCGTGQRRYDQTFTIRTLPSASNGLPETRTHLSSWCFDVSSCGNIGRSAVDIVQLMPNGQQTSASGYDWSVVSRNPRNGPFLLTCNVLDTTLTGLFNISYRLAQGASWSIAGSLVLRNSDTSNTAYIDRVVFSFLPPSMQSVSSSCGSNMLLPGMTTTCNFWGVYSSNPGRMHVDVIMIPGSAIQGASLDFDIQWQTSQAGGTDNCVLATSRTETGEITNQGQYCAGAQPQGAYLVSVTRQVCLPCGRQYDLSITLQTASQSLPPEIDSATSLWQYTVACQNQQ